MITTLKKSVLLFLSPGQPCHGKLRAPQQRHQLHCKSRCTESPRHNLELGAFYKEKRDLLQQLMSASKFNMVLTSGTYFQLADYAAINDESDTEFAVRLIRKHKVVVIPTPVLYKEAPEQDVVRFWFAKNSDTLREAAD